MTELTIKVKVNIDEPIDINEVEDFFKDLRAVIANDAMKYCTFFGGNEVKVTSDLKRRAELKKINRQE